MVARKPKSKGHERLSRVVKTLHVWIVVVVLWTGSFIKTHSAVHLIQVHCITCKLYLEVGLFKR